MSRFRSGCDGGAHSRSDRCPRGTLSERRLRSLLDHDCKDGRIPADRGGKISRRHYAGLLGCTHSALARFKAVFAEYEQRLGVVTGPMQHFSEMRKWLTKSYESREIGIRDNKLDRVAFMMHFGLRGGTFMTRHPPIRKLFEEFDARAKRESYLPLERYKELERVVAVLAAGPVLNKDRMTINQVELAKTAKVPRARLGSRPFADVVAASQATISAEVAASRIDPYVHGRVFPFSDLIAPWSELFLERVGIRFKHIAVGLSPSTVKGPYLQLVHMLAWIGRSENPHCRTVVAEANKFGRVHSVDEWEDALFVYRDRLVATIADGSATESSVDGAISALRIVLNALSSAQVVPPVAITLPGIKHVRRRRGHLRSVAEASLTDAGRKADYVAFARDRFLDACKVSGTDMGMGDTDDFINGLTVEISVSHDLSSDPVEAIRLVLERRLSALHSHAAAIVDSAVKARQRGHELLSRSQIDGAAFEADYLASTGNPYKLRQLVREFFPNPADSTKAKTEQGVANLLALIQQRCGGVPPVGNKNNSLGYGQFFAKRYLAYGGLATIGRLLNPDSDTVGAVLTLYLIESGANVSVGRTLDRECMEASDLSKYCRITGYKARAKGKPIIVDLPESSPAVEAIKWFLSSSEELKAAAGRDSDRLFLMRIGGRVQLMTPHWYNNWFKSFAGSVPELQGVKLLPSMIRPSVLLHASLGNEGRLAVGMAIGQHGLAVTQGYQQKWPTRLLYDENIRRFQKAFETLVLSGAEDVALKLGITVEQFTARLGELRATGLGTFCRDQRGRSSEPGKKCSTLDCWNDCPHMLIVAEVEAIAALQLWQRSLRAARPDWERDQPERWDRVWLPWLCLTDVVEEKMVRGPMIKIWNAAMRRASEISAKSDYVPPHPW